MASGVGALKALLISRELKRGYHADGGGLYLQVSATGAKSWVFRFQLLGKTREMGLGSFITISLAEARELARDCRKLVQAGEDPIIVREQRRLALSRQLLQNKNFDECSKAYIDSHKTAWRSEKHAKQWTASLAAYASPIIGSHNVANLDTLNILKILQPIWATKSETATRLRGRIEAILDWATVCGYRKGENPARWKGHLSKLLPAPIKVAKVVHHPALPYAEISDFVALLKNDSGVGAAALEFTILTAARTAEVIWATWSEISFENRLWVVPSDRMKGGRQHRVPLSEPALEILRNVQKLAVGAAVFPGQSANGHLSNMAMLAVLKRMGRGDITAHGFRSTFRDWVSECTNFPREVAEMALAHMVENQVEAAYRRGDLFEKRRILMDQWADVTQHGTSNESLCMAIGGQK